jgi:hypothetical protein
MEWLLGFVVIAVLIGVVVTLLSGGSTKDAVQGGLVGGLYAGGCLLQALLSVLPFALGLFILFVILRGCS